VRALRCRSVRKPGSAGGIIVALDEWRALFEWGPVGARRLVECGARTIVVVDVLSFTTAVSIAVAGGTEVWPSRPGREATGLARRVGAELAADREATTPERPWSLSPAALLAAPPAGRLVLPSPNGSAIAAAAEGCTVVAASLRNRAAVGRHLAGRPPGAIGVVASGERFEDGSLRPAVEDLLGASLVLAALSGAGGRLSPEARVATRAAVGMTASELRETVVGSVSGVELEGRGFVQDVEAAVELDVDDVVPVMREGRFVPMEIS
jgi:2-phosphosulfolactate phosphatase